MSDRTPRTAGNAPSLIPFAQRPQRWKRQQSRAQRGGHVVCGPDCSGCAPVVIRERTGWGWIDWTVPADGSPPDQAHRIAVFTPHPTRAQRTGLRWLARRPTHRIRLGPLTARPATAGTAALGLVLGLLALARGIPAAVVLPAAALAVLLAEHLPDALDARAGEHARTVEGEAACRFLQRLAAWHTHLTHADPGGDPYVLRRAAEIGRHTLWDAAELLHTHDTRTVSDQLIACEQLMVQLADQIGRRAPEHTRTQDAPADAHPAHPHARPLGPYPPGTRRTAHPTPKPPPASPTLKGFHAMTTRPDTTTRTADVYLLFAHEPYYPGPGTQEINTTLVAAASLLHPTVAQPDGARIHDRLTRGRRHQEIVPLATLTHELDGGADWPTVGDWERVTADLVGLVRAGECDALSLGLPEIARALVCTGPHSQVRSYDQAADEFLAHGPTDRAQVLAKVDLFLTPLVAERQLWPGNGLLPPLAARENNDEPGTPRYWPYA
ncbi:hypothetical protein [Streptomyces fructofermentans]|uniref:Uncharacterized protein n=1 Tax=Streptomyces fructofermentans TaxID=152141 RepID=A0A918U6V4_9ACTN|nr:hypothetical protein [Streptomyces fructofermentans]GGX99847.1 hypothetical protein GCM10010515_77360 [Streptomyces fructofermentans]